MNLARFDHFVTQQLIARRKCKDDISLLCGPTAIIKKANCVECANRYYQKLADIEMEELKDG
jgi:hypothetical protein